MSKNLKWSVFACSLFAICFTVSFGYLLSTQGERHPASDGSNLDKARWAESKISPYYGADY